MTATIRISTRTSALARAQAESVAQRLRNRLRVETELVPVTTSGDRSAAPLTEIGGQGVFIGAVRQAVLDGTADLAVHSMKDLPTTSDEAVVIAAVPVRDTPADCLVASGGRRLEQLPPGAKVGTGSLRRAAQLLALRPDLEVVPIRGNVDTRLAKVAAGELDAVVLAAAGLSRLGLLDRVTDELDTDEMLPAPGQGALAVEAAVSAGGLVDDVAGIDDAATRVAVSAERSLLQALDAGCTSPVGALAVLSLAGGADEKLMLTGLVAAPDGSRLVRLKTAGSAAHATRLGQDLAARLLAAGAGELARAAVP